MPRSNPEQSGQGVFRQMKDCPNRDCQNGEVESSGTPCGRAGTHGTHTYSSNGSARRLGKETSQMAVCSGQPGMTTCGTCRGSGKVPK
jgi:hypothetical protein